MVIDVLGEFLAELVKWVVGAVPCRLHFYWTEFESSW